jgi:hypothetical protein
MLMMAAVARLAAVIIVACAVMIVIVSHIFALLFAAKVGTILCNWVAKCLIQ